MRFVHYKPAPPLDTFVDLIWLYYSEPQAHAYERLMPSGEAELVINLLDGSIGMYPDIHTEQRTSLGHAALSGPHSRSFVIDTLQKAAVAGVHFKPGGSFPFFRPPSDALRDIHVPLDALWSSRAAEIRERLLAATTDAARLRVLERCLLEQLVRPPERHPAVEYALRVFSASSVPAVSFVTRQIGMSQRRFIELFGHHVGLTPKAFCRVRRFQRVLSTVHHVTEVDWAQTALECGYYDQAHFIHDFRDFSGLTPTSYLAHRTAHLNHVPIVR
jgi:methylphosphotriester-DNA--protein-cysteine methyltransferase